MVKFRFYDKKQKKFVDQSEGGKVWENRYNLEIWDNTVKDTNLEEMYKIMTANEKHLELHVKVGSRYQPYSKEVLEQVVTEYKKKEPERKEKRRKFREHMKKLIKRKSVVKRKYSLKKTPVKVSIKKSKKK
jgi:hypothetical protein